MESNWQNILSINTYLKLDSAHGSINITRVSSSGPDESAVLGLSSTGNVTSLSPIIDHTAVYPLPNNLFNPPLIYFFFPIPLQTDWRRKKKVIGFPSGKVRCGWKVSFEDRRCLVHNVPDCHLRPHCGISEIGFLFKTETVEGEKKMNKNVTLLQYQDPQSFLCGSRNFPPLFF